MWQDLMISAGGVFFTLALIPSLLSKDKPAITTSVMTSAILFAMIITYASLDLWLSAIMNAVMCTMWGILALQKFKSRKRIK